MDGKGQIFKGEKSARKTEAPCADTDGWQGNAITWAMMAGANPTRAMFFFWGENYSGINVEVLLDVSKTRVTPKWMVYNGKLFPHLSGEGC